MRLRALHSIAVCSYHVPVADNDEKSNEQHTVVEEVTLEALSAGKVAAVERGRSSGGGKCKLERTQGATELLAATESLYCRCGSECITGTGSQCGSTPVCKAYSIGTVHFQQTVSNSTVVCDHHSNFAECNA